MFWTLHPIRHILRILGATVIVRIVWNVCCKYRTVRRGRSLLNDRISNGHEESLEDLNKLNDDFLALKRRIAVLMADHHHDEQAKDYQMYEDLWAREKLQKQIEEHERSLRAELKLKSDLSATELFATLDAFLLVQELDKAKYVEAVELANRESLVLRDTVQNQKAACQKFQMHMSRAAKVRFANLLELFDDKLFQSEFRTFAQCKEVYDQNGVADQHSRDGIQRIADEGYVAWQKLLDERCCNCQRRLAEFEVSVLSRMVPDLSALSSQLDYLGYDGSDGELTYILWRIPGFREQMTDLWQDGTPIKCRESFFFGNELEVRPVLRPSAPPDDFVEIHLEFKEDEDGQAVHAPVLHYRVFKLLDQRPSYPTCDIALLDRPSFSETGSMKDPYFTTGGICQVDDLKGDSKFIKNDQVLIKILLYPLSFIEKYLLIAHDGIIRWRFDHYSWMIHYEVLGRKTYLLSAPFRTKTGYIAHVEALFSDLGDEDDLFISFKVRFLLGSSDGSLAHPLKGKCTFILEDQSDAKNKRNIERQVLFRYDNVQTKSVKGRKGQTRTFSVWLAPQCFLRSVADNPPYMKDDSIIVKAVVDVL